MSVDPDARDPRLHLTIPIRLARRGSELKLVMADRPETHRDRNLIGRLAKGYLWFEELRTGAVSSLAAIAEREGITVPMVRRACDLAFLSTDMIEAILAGEQPIDINTEAFKLAYPLPIDGRNKGGCSATPDPTKHRAATRSGPPVGRLFRSDANRRPERP